MIRGMSETIRFDPDLHVFVTVGGIEISPARDDCLVFPFLAVAEVPIRDLAQAVVTYEELDSATVSHVFLSAAPVDDFDQDLARREVWLTVAGVNLTAETGMSVDGGAVPTDQENRALVGPLLTRHDAVWGGQWVDDQDGHVSVGIAAGLCDPDRPIRDLWELARDLEALLTAASGGAITASSATDLVRAGRAQALIGQPEASFLDAKRQPYPLSTDAQKWEMAKDVAAFVNAGREALIVLGISTTSTTSGDVLAAPHLFELASFDVVAARGILRDRIVPLLQDVEIDVVESRNGYGYGYIHIPVQPAELRPYIVAGALVGGSYMGAHLSVPVRSGEDTHMMDASSIHSLIAAGRVALHQASLAFSKPGSTA
jgi:hypothetical protein